MTSSARVNFENTYEIQSIILFGGIAGGATNSKLIGSLAGDLDLRFIPIVGGSLVSNQVATYPFANQAVAANAIIQQPLKISMLMICPANSETVGYISKSSAITALVTSLNQHNNLGGLYSVVTPSYTYTNCLLTDMYDATDGRSKQAQYQWRLDFLQPLITLQQAQAAQNSMMQKLASGSGPVSSLAGPIASALQIVGVSSDDLTSGILDALDGPLSDAGISTGNGPSLGSFISSAVQAAMTGNFSLGNLTQSLISGLTQSAGQAGVNTSTLSSLVKTALEPALSSLGLGSSQVSRSLMQALSAPISNGGAPPFTS